MRAIDMRGENALKQVEPNLQTTNNHDETHTLCKPNKHPDYGTNQPIDRTSSVSIADIIGSFGWFQFMVLLFSGLREGAVGYDAVIMSIALRPEHGFLCADQILADTRTSVLEEETNLKVGHFWGSKQKEAPVNISDQIRECYIGAKGSEDPLELVRCESWLFPQTNRAKSLVADWSLVCQHEWLIAAIESVYFFGLVAGNLIWGYLADRIGRRKAYLIAHGLAMFAGCASVIAPTIELFAFCRFLSAFGSISYNIIYSIQIELIGTKHRAFSTTMNHLGWGLGVISVPLADRLFDSHYRYLVAMAPFLAVIMYPLAFWLPESSRWLMIHGHQEEARKELMRAAKFNGKEIDKQLEKKITRLEQRVVEEVLQSNYDKGSNDCYHSYRLLLSSPKLLRDTFVLAFCSFSGHLFYYLLTINFAYIESLSVEANFITSGAGEWISVIVGALLLKICSRKFCMSLFISLIGLTFIIQALIDSELIQSDNLSTIVNMNNGTGTLSALLLIFVVLIVNQEVYPTIIRQTGSSIVNTLGESGSMIAPIAIQLSRIIGSWKTDIVYATVCAFGLVGIQFITRTDDIELLDT